MQRMHNIMPKKLKNIMINHMRIELNHGNIMLMHTIVINLHKVHKMNIVKETEKEVEKQ